MRYIVLLLVLALAVLPAPVIAKEARPLADDPAIEARLAALGQNLRCLVCQNQTLAASDSDFANDLRDEMRVMMKKGMSDQQIIDFLVQRFGDFILFRPPVRGNTVLLWFGPLLLLILGGVVLVLVLRRRGRNPAENETLSADEHRRAEALLQGEVDVQPGVAKNDKQANEGHGA